MLFNDKLHIANYFPVPATFELKSIKPLYPTVADELQGLLSNSLFDAIVDKHKAGVDDKLLELCRYAFGFKVFYHWVDFGDVSATSGGFRVSESPNQKVASESRVYKLKMAANFQAHLAFDRLLNYCLKNKPKGFTSSDWYKSFGNCFIKTYSDFSDFLKLQSPYIFSRLAPYLVLIENSVIADIFGNELNEIKNKSHLNDVQKKAVYFAKSALAHLGLAEALTPLSLTINENGVLLFSTEATRQAKTYITAEQARIEAYKKQLTDTGNAQLEKLTELIENQKTFLADAPTPNHININQPQNKGYFA